MDDDDIETYDDDDPQFSGFEEECYMGPDGRCGAAGTEHCDWDCPNRKKI